MKYPRHAGEGELKASIYSPISVCIRLDRSRWIEVLTVRLKVQLITCGKRRDIPHPGRGVVSKLQDKV